MTLQFTLEDAYRAACTTIGELVVRERFLTNRVDELTTRLTDTATTAVESEPDKEKTA